MVKWNVLLAIMKTIPGSLRKNSKKIESQYFCALGNEVRFQDQDKRLKLWNGRKCDPYIGIPALINHLFIEQFLFLEMLNKLVFVAKAVDCAYPHSSTTDRLF